MDPVVVAALEAVSKRVNVRTGLALAFDRAVATEALELLWRSGYPLPRTEIASWALVHGWDREGVEDLGEAIEGVVAGRRPRLMAHTFWSADTVERWRAQTTG